MGKNNKSIVIRKIEAEDVESLIIFFIEAYGEKTVFQCEKFLAYYFGYNEKGNNMNYGYSLIGVTNTGKIVSHYGGLFSELKVENKVIPIVWGVSAFTLSEARGKGLNSDILNWFLKRNSVNGVIGFTRSTADFYKRLGYNIFEFNRMTRFLLTIDGEKTKEIVSSLNGGENLLQIIETKKLIKTTNKIDSSVIQLTKNNIGQFIFDLTTKVKVTTNRSIDYLKWRIFDNPDIAYKVWGYLIEDVVVSYVVLRVEVLAPYMYNVARIVDLFGDEGALSAIIDKVIYDSIDGGSIYIDFSMFGTKYHDVLSNKGFHKLSDDEVSYIPQVTSPIEKRANHEFVGIQSTDEAGLIAELAIEDVYFTRIDSDRDRVSRLK